jgi:hypothetical protein
MTTNYHLLLPLKLKRAKAYNVTKWKDFEELHGL